MANTKISDVIVPEVFTDYVLEQANKTNRLIQSGGAVISPAISTFLAGGGLTLNVPSWKAIDSGDFEDATDDTTAATVNAVTGDKQIAVRMEYSKTWGAANLATALAGDNPLRQVGAQVASAVLAERQGRIISMLNGMFGTSGALTATHLNDESTTAFSADLLIDTLAPWGDVADGMVTLVVHSAIFRSMQKENLITFRPLSDQSIMFPVYMGQYLIVVDDTCPKVGNVYTSYMFKPGAIQLGVGQGETVLHSEPLEGKGKGIEYVIQRDTFAAHVTGMKFTSDTITGETPTKANLAVVANWAKVYADKFIPVAALKSLV
jgi:hypothetical protein